HLRPTFFAEVFLYSAQSFKDGIKDGLVRLPFGDEGKHAPIAAEDQARVIANSLEQPSAHEGETYRLFGPKEYTFLEAVAKNSEVLGREVKYERIPLDAYHEQMVKRLGPFLAQYIIEVAKDHAAGVFSGTDEVIENITGQPPMGLEEYIRKLV